MFVKLAKTHQHCEFNSDSLLYALMRKIIEQGSKGINQMENLPSRDIELLMSWERIARALEAMHLNHEERTERIALMGKMVKRPMAWATTDFLKWLYPLYEILLTLHNNEFPHMTHHDIKRGLRFFAELCQAAREDLKTIEGNRSLDMHRFQIETFDVPFDFEDVETFGVKHDDTRKFDHLSSEEYSSDDDDRPAYPGHNVGGEIESHPFENGNRE